VRQCLGDRAPEPTSPSPERASRPAWQRACRRPGPFCRRLPVWPVRRALLWQPCRDQERSRPAPWVLPLLFRIQLPPAAPPFRRTVPRRGRWPPLRLSRPPASRWTACPSPRDADPATLELFRAQPFRAQPFRQPFSRQSFPSCSAPAPKLPERRPLQPYRALLPGLRGRSARGSPHGDHRAIRRDRPRPGHDGGPGREPRARGCVAPPHGSWNGGEAASALPPGEAVAPSPRDARAAPDRRGGSLLWVAVASCPARSPG